MIPSVLRTCCCQDERPSGVRKVCAWNVDSIATSSSYPALTCLVSCSPEGSEKLLIGRLLLDFLEFCTFGPSVDTRSCVSAGCLQTSCGHFLREDVARVLRSISKNDVYFEGSIISDSHLFELVRLRSTGSRTVPGDDFPRRFHYSLFAFARQWIHAHTSIYGGGKMLTPIRVLVGGGSFARVSVARGMKNFIMRLFLASMVFLRPCTFPAQRPVSFLTLVLSLLASKASVTREYFANLNASSTQVEGVRACVELQLFLRVLCGIGHCLVNCPPVEGRLLRSLAV